MSPFDLQESFDRAARRLDGTSGKRRADRGRLRLEREIVEELAVLLNGRERPPVRQVMEELESFCAERRLRPPSRATIYQAMERLPARSFAIDELPQPAKDALYNLAGSGPIPGHQLAFYCLNYGGAEALSFAAGLPWLALYQAARLPGWRKRSRGLLEAILRARKISR